MNALALARAAPALMRGDLEGLVSLVPPSLVRSAGAVASLAPGAGALALTAPPDRIRADLGRVAAAWDLPPALLDVATAIHRGETGASWKPAAAAVLEAAHGTLAKPGDPDLSAGLRRYAARLYGPERAAELGGYVAGMWLLAELQSAGVQLEELTGAATEEL